MDLIHFMQWPAMVVSVIAAALVGAQSKSRRQQGFWWFLASNALWIIWAVPEQAWALLVLQVALAGMNIRGASKNQRKS